MYYKICRGKVSFSLKQSIAFLKGLFAAEEKNRALVAKFETEFADYLGVKNAIAVSCAKIALDIVLKALDTKAGDQIIVPAYTVPEVIDIIICNELIPVFADISLDDANIDPAQVEKLVSDKTRFILMTHMHGNPCDIDAIINISKKYNITVIEDAAQACGAEYKGKKTGTFGRIGYFSFGMLKNVNTLGGSIIVTDDKALDFKIREQAGKYKQISKSVLAGRLIKTVTLSVLTSDFVFSLLVYPVLRLLGGNKDKQINNALKVKPITEKELDRFRVRFSSSQAMIGSSQIKFIDIVNGRKKEKADILNRELISLNKINLFKLSDAAEGIYLNYVIRTENRQKLIEFLFKNGIDTSPGFVRACPDLEQFASFGYKCPNSSRLESENIYLPIYDPLNSDDMLRISKIIKKYYES